MTSGALQAGPWSGAGVLRRYAEWLPVDQSTPEVTLGEGSTPLVRAASLEQATGADEVWLKLEMCNPTGSFKDRGMAVAVAKAVEQGANAVLCASTGNTSASAAAYAARCGLRAFVLVPEGRIAKGKLAQAAAHGAKILAVDGNFDDALRSAQQLTERMPVALVNSLNPFRIEGQKTAALEIVDQMATRPMCTASRWATPATSPPTGRDIASTSRPSVRRGCRRCWACRRRERRRWCWAERWRSPRRSRPRYGSDHRRRGTAQYRRGTIARNDRRGQR